jgi:hypothetical protein
MIPSNRHVLTGVVTCHETYESLWAAEGLTEVSCSAEITLRAYGIILEDDFQGGQVTLQSSAETALLLVHCSQSDGHPWGGSL